MLEDASFRRLSLETRAKLRSTQILTSLPQIVSELLQNSLDAQATRIEIGVDCEEWGCWVRDDGSGISKNDLGSLAKPSDDQRRYGTSKVYDPSSMDHVSTFGFRGEALSSAAELCCVEIASRTARSRESHSIILKGGKSLYFGPSIRWKREGHGTVACIRDAFFNLPIRRMSHPPSHKTLDLIRQDIETYALVSPNVSFSLEDTSKTRQPGSSKGHLLRIPKHFHMHIYGPDINRHPIEFCDLHRTIDLEFSTSSFAKHVKSIYTRRSPRKGEKRPAYVLNLIVDPKHIDNCLEPAKTSVALENKNQASSFLSSAIRAFLVRHGFSRQTLSPRKRRKLEPGPSRQPVNLDEDSSQGNPGEKTLYIRGYDHDTQHTTWTDPITREVFAVDCRTGNSYPRERDMRPMNSSIDDRPMLNKPLLPSESEGGADHESCKAMPQWLKDALNPIEDLWSNTPREPSGMWQNPRSARRTPPGTHTIMTLGRFDKKGIANAEVVKQVDQKFIACLIDSSEESLQSRSLVLLDQHAADERIRVERYLKELCLGFLRRPPYEQGVETETLEPARPVLLTLQEASWLHANSGFRSVFRSWGFEVLLSDKDPEDDEQSHADAYTQVRIRTLPQVISEKLKTGHELQEFVKGYLAKLHNEELHGLDSMPRKESGETTDDWLKALRWCPRELIELINSKACRGAIMFNDRLNHEQCQRLVRQLAETIFPFQCAHGRPSIVPLADLSSGCPRSTVPPVPWEEFNIA
ncbi:hypothetical protein CONPUDRAFT_89709 [Coniophora puteana RWD-64-598 SS2]|uniref:MutL C-terminal dimerisation domain-containing protein n=1 Tax=Coniophora puteana (strain RWD-64-598) TaxID=741705 RepID=A0A5M3MU88_CONPW|nr:uncharacterized protein CONPUDRAFT_89709 [Coniophora puteana RWD-64-598 SS2]EIW82275.1 hypothetical protein CONPUDRAFT_89709 [Coniophora puteana RWD-64-598 SS2]